MKTLKTSLQQTMRDGWTDLSIGMWQRTLAHNRGLKFAEGTEGAVPARVNHGRWLADCPYCAGAELVETNEVFYCFSCGMEKNGSHPAAVTFPANRAEIERVLELREIDNQNWFPSESVDDLTIENIKGLK